MCDSILKRREVYKVKGTFRGRVVAAWDRDGSQGRGQKESELERHKGQMTSSLQTCKMHP